MKRLSKLFKWLVAGFIFVVTIDLLIFLGKFVNYLIYEDFIPKEILRLNIPDGISKSGFIALVVATSIGFIYLLYHFIKLRRVANDFSKKEVFSLENAKSLSSIGKGILVFSIVLIIIDFTLIGFLDLDLNENRNSASKAGWYVGKIIGYFSGVLVKWFPLLILGIFISIISELITKGSFLKEENDLTI